jgi:hypothetical protein
MTAKPNDHRGAADLPAILAALELMPANAVDRIAPRALDLKTDTGDRRARHAASIYRAPENAGRKEFEDGELLDKVAGLIVAGKGRSTVTIVARSASIDPKQQYAIAQRLRRK